ncbi:MAG: DUF308 domain-containing protein, partial [Ramlibacter sp.]|nr:DUF308 domain-containing protein [Cryobacterium sp.]
IAIVAGSVVLFAPVESISFLIIAGGIFLVLSGLFQIVQAFVFGRGLRATPDTA